MQTPVQEVSVNMLSSVRYYSAHTFDHQISDVTQILRYVVLLEIPEKLSIHGQVIFCIAMNVFNKQNEISEAASSCYTQLPQILLGHSLVNVYFRGRTNLTHNFSVY